MRAWHPFGASQIHQPPDLGALIAHLHAVWKVTSVENLPLSEADRDAWLNAGMPDPATWRQRPYRLRVEWIAGARPAWAAEGEPVQPAHLDVPGGQLAGWMVYKGGRWAMCSCCGEPMPCRAELEDREVRAALRHVDKLERRLPGCCWACEEPISSRQQAVTYPGGNVDLPGGPEVRFHMRRSCRWTAERYEARWLAEDPRRERILTWPSCGGRLVVHGDGSSECHGGDQPDCQGHLTHDHRCLSACYALGESWECPRGCGRSHGTRVSPRPPRRDRATLTS